VWCIPLTAGLNPFNIGGGDEAGVGWSSKDM
jgi:hypothetical protein